MSNCYREVSRSWLTRATSSAPRWQSAAFVATLVGTLCVFEAHAATYGNITNFFWSNPLAWSNDFTTGGPGSNPDTNSAETIVLLRGGPELHLYKRLSGRNP